jgi:hypothetical protein
MTETIEQFLARGGQIQQCRKGTPKDIQSMKYGYGLFGGRRRYAASVMRRQESGTGEDIFSTISKPSTVSC